MTAGASTGGRLLAGAAVVLLLLLAACQGEAPVPGPPAAPDPAIGEIREARSALGRPAVALAEEVLALSSALDQARHRARRGEAMAAALEEVAARTVVVRAATEEADLTAAALPEDGSPLVVDAARVVETATREARDAADAADIEREALLALVAIDLRLDEAVAAWDEPGSQSERRVALAALAEALDALAAEAAALPPSPEGCTALAANRVAWAELLADRSRRLGASATSGSGSEYDDLRVAFARDPYAEDRQVADAADRACWLRESAVAQAAEASPAHVEALEAALNP